MGTEDLEEVAIADSVVTVAATVVLATAATIARATATALMAWGATDLAVVITVRTTDLTSVRITTAITVDTDIPATATADAGKSPR